MEHSEALGDSNALVIPDRVAPRLEASAFELNPVLIVDDDVRRLHQSSGTMGPISYVSCFREADLMRTVMTIPEGILSDANYTSQSRTS